MNGCHCMGAHLGRQHALIASGLLLWRSICRGRVTTACPVCLSSLAGSVSSCSVARGRLRLSLGSSGIGRLGRCAASLPAPASCRPAPPTLAPSSAAAIATTVSPAPSLGLLSFRLLPCCLGVGLAWLLCAWSQ